VVRTNSNQYVPGRLIWFNGSVLEIFDSVGLPESLQGMVMPRSLRICSEAEKYIIISILHCIKANPFGVTY
jgi:hypothetical protein